MTEGRKSESEKRKEKTIPSSLSEILHEKANKQAPREYPTVSLVRQFQSLFAIPPYVFAGTMFRPSTSVQMINLEFWGP